MQPTAQCKSNVYITERQQLENSATRTTSKDTTDSRMTTCCLATAAVEHTDTPASNESSQRRAHWTQRSSDRADEPEYPSEPSAAMVAAIGTATAIVVTPKTKNDKIDLTVDNNGICCRDCRSGRCPIIDGSVMLGIGGKPSVRKLIRKSRSRKQKTHETCHARIRSLSVGNEASFRNSCRRNGRTIDGIGGNASSGASGKERNAECLNNLRRNDLIDIIRESMEKNRLCFQSTG